MSYEDYFQEPTDSMTLEEKIEIIKRNSLAASNLTKEIRSWSDSVQKIAASPTTFDIETPFTETKKNNDSEDSEIKELYNKISLLDISGMSEEEIISKLKDILGSSITPIILNKIKLMLYKEHIIYSKMFTTVTSEKELQELSATIASISSKIELLDELEELETEEEISEEITENNNLFFLTSLNGNVIALESLRKNIPRDYYQIFKELILGLKNGKLKSTRRLTTKGYSELKINLKGPGLRLTFDKLSNGNYIILDCFMKRRDTSGSYRSMMLNRSIQYQNKKDLYLSNLENPEFIKEHEGYLAEILTLLDSKTLEGDDLNETRTI